MPFCSFFFFFFNAMPNSSSALLSVHTSELVFILWFYCFLWLFFSFQVTASAPPKETNPRHIRMLLSGILHNVYCHQVTWVDFIVLSCEDLAKQWLVDWINRRKKKISVRVQLAFISPLSHRIIQLASILVMDFAKIQINGGTGNKML